MTRRIVLVSGPPGAGKSTLAGPLAEKLGFPLLSKDHIKESLYDSLDVAPDLESSRRLGAAAMRLLWSLAGRFPDAVLEANFLPRHTVPEVAGVGPVVTVDTAGSVDLDMVIGRIRAEFAPPAGSRR